MPRGDNEGSEDQAEGPAKRRLEAAASVLGAILALGTIGLILWDEIRSGDGPPIIVVEARGVHAHPDGFVLEVRAVNRGDQAAAQVAIEGSLKRGAEVVETAEATFDYVPSRSTRDGGLFFAQDPRLFEAELRALGYIEP